MRYRHADVPWGRTGGERSLQQRMLARRTDIEDAQAQKLLDTVPKQVGKLLVYEQKAPRVEVKNISRRR